jgi:hypothetical protein
VIIIKYIFAIGIILLLLLGWVTVQYAYRRFAVKHPDLGPYRDDFGSCGSCGCGTNGCSSE